MSSSPTPSDPVPYDPVAGEKLIVETPEQTAIEFPLAGIGSRFIAILIDSLIQGAVMLAVVLVLLGIGIGFSNILSSTDTSDAAAIWAIAIIILAVFLVTNGYFILFESIWNGQTPGKRLTHIRVIKDNGQPITPIDAVARNLMRIVDQMPAIYGIGVLVAWLSPQSKRLGDYVAGTVVVHEKPLDAVTPQWGTAPAAATQHYGANRLTPEEFAVIEAFLSRRSALDAGVRYDTAASIIRRIESKLTLPPDRPSAEKLLEELSNERRSTGGYR